MSVVFRRIWLFRNVPPFLRKFARRKTYLVMHDILPPEGVKGMKVLNKALFEKVVSVPCLVIDLCKLKTVLKQVKPYLLRLSSLKAIRDRNDGTKEVLLDPRSIKCFGDFRAEEKEALNSLKVKPNLEYVDLKLTYDNWKASEIFNAVIPKHLGAVASYSIIGHIVHLNLKKEMLDYRDVIGSVLLDKVPQARTVVNKLDIIDSEFRTFKLEVLAGSGDFEVEVIENRCVYKFDFSKVYWNPRLSTEHLRVVEKLSKGDYLYDLFAGVGPFAVPAAKKGCIVLANDLNALAVEYLKKNMVLNKTEAFLTTVKDAGVFIKEDFKSHFIRLNSGDFKVFLTMNLPALAPSFLPHFKGLYSIHEEYKVNFLPVPEVYIYCFIKNQSDPVSSARELICEHLSMDLEDEIDSISFVRNVAPNKEMMRVVLRLTSRILVSQKRSASTDEPCYIKKPNPESVSEIEDKENEKSKEKPL